MLNFANSTVGYENWYCFVSIEPDVMKKRQFAENFVVSVTNFLWVY